MPSMAINFYEVEDIPDNDEDPSGGDITENLISETILNAWIPGLPIPSSPDPAKVVYYKEGAQNDEEDYSLAADSKWWLVNGGYKMASPSVFTLQTDDSANTQKVKITFQRASDDVWITETLTANGTTLVLGGINAKAGAEWYAECVDSTGSAIEQATANLFIGDVSGNLAFIPTSRETAQTLWTFGLDTVKNDDTSSADTREDPPDDIVFTEAFSYADAVNMADELEPTDWHGLWVAGTMPPDMLRPISFLRPVVGYKGLKIPYGVGS